MVKDSPYFDRALNGPFLEGQTQTIDLQDDVDAEAFALYVDLAFRSYFDENFKLRDKHLGSRAKKPHTLPRLWKLADRFLNGRLQAVATEGMAWLLRDYKVQILEFYYQDASSSHHQLFYWFKWLQRRFRICLMHDIPFKDMLAEAAAAMPPQIFSELHDTLDPEFRFAVTKKFIKRFENPNLKRPLREGESTPAKRKKQN